MVFSRRLFVQAAVASTAFFNTANSRAQANTGNRNTSTVIIGGTGSALGIMRVLAEGFRALYPAWRVEVLPSLGSGGGIKALVAGAVDVSVSARRVKHSETESGAVSHDFAITPVVFATNWGTPCRDISLEELEHLYADEAPRWCDGRPVRPVIRPPSEADTKLLTGMTPAMPAIIEKARARFGHMTVRNDQENADALVRLEGSLGMISLGQIMTENRRLRILRVGSAEPTVEALAAGRYSLTKSLYLVGGESMTEAGAAFLDFALSPVGRAVIRQSGFLPLTSVS